MIEELNEIIHSLKEENKQLRYDIDYLCDDRKSEKKRADKLEEQIKTLRELYEEEANRADEYYTELQEKEIICAKREKKSDGNKSMKKIDLERCVRDLESRVKELERKTAKVQYPKVPVFKGV